MTNKKGITLIALVVSIVVLLILSGISIQMLNGDNGILTKTATAKQATEEATELELIRLAVTAAQTAGEGQLTEENLNNELRINFDDENATTEKIGSNWYYKGYCIEENGNVEKYDKLLPEEYQQVEYIESTGTQYIDTKLFGKSELKCFIKFTTPNNTKSMDQNVLGCIDKNWFRVYPLTLFQGKWGQGYSDNSYSVTGYLKDYTTYEIESYLGKTSQYLKVDGIVLINTNKNYDFTSELTMYLCARNLNNSTTNNIPNYFFSGKIYYCKIYDTNMEVRNFIPCYSTTTVTDVNGKQCPKDTIGLYDTVKGKFYTNQGTGIFLKGNDV